MVRLRHHGPRSSPRRRACAALFGALALPAGSAFAADLSPDAMFVQLGAGRATDTAAIGLNWLWPRQWHWAGGELSGYWELSLGRWASPNARGGDAAWVSQFGITPVLRWRPSDVPRTWFVEAGIGANVVSPLYRNRRESFSTIFNFGDHLAVGRNFGADGAHEVALRIQHFSNAGLSEPNPGANFVQLRYAYTFR